MTASAIDELRRRWKVNGVLEATERALDAVGFDAAYVSASIQSGRSNRPKVIKDGIWGMVEVDASSLRLLDCPIVQRLRAIHQLGFSYLTYPSAEHSRFAHSLGMFSVVSRFLEAVKRRKMPPVVVGAPHSDWQPNDDQVRIAVHAAILHDIGHMPFSHVTESILHARPEEFTCGPITIDDFLIDAQDLLGSDKLAELLSVAIVLTDRFNDFYSHHVEPNSQPNDTLRIASLILGQATEPEYEGIAKLISGDAIDADKIDYINRDGASCGIAVGVDVSRLFLRSRFLMVSRSELRRLRELEKDPPQEQVIFVVNASGLDSIEEIGQARTMLYHRVYLHQTTRNAERLLGKALEANIDESGGADPVTDALELWTYDDFELLKRMSAKTGEAASLAARLRSRRLPKRACAFGRRFVKMGAPVRSIFPAMSPKDASVLVKQVVGTALEEFRSPRLAGKKLSDLEAAIAAEASLLATQLRKAGLPAPPMEVLHLFRFFQ